MIGINSKISEINGKRGVKFLYPNQIPGLRTWLRNYSLSDFTLNFQSQSGTVNTTAGGNTITGSGTSFSAIDVGKRIRINGEDKWIATYNNSTSITVDTNFVNTNSSVVYSYGFISSWIDKSGDLQNYSQVTAGAQPLVYLVNGKPTVFLNSNRDSDYLQVASKNLGTTQTYFFKLSNSKTTIASDLFNSQNPTDQRPRIAFSNNIYNENLYPYNFETGSKTWAASLLSKKRKKSIAVVNTGLGWGIYEEDNKSNGVVSNSGNPTVAVTINANFILGNYTNQNSTYSFKGYIDEVIIYDLVLTNYQRAMILNYLNYLQ